MQVVERHLLPTCSRRQTNVITISLQLRFTYLRSLFLYDTLPFLLRLDTLARISIIATVALRIARLVPTGHRDTLTLIKRIEKVRSLPFVRHRGVCGPA